MWISSFPNLSTMQPQKRFISKLIFMDDWDLKLAIIKKIIYEGSQIIWHLQKLDAETALRVPKS